MTEPATKVLLAKNPALSSSATVPRAAKPSSRMLLSTFSAAGSAAQGSPGASASVSAGEQAAMATGGGHKIYTNPVDKKATLLYSLGFLRTITIKKINTFSNFFK